MELVSHSEGILIALYPLVGLAACAGVTMVFDWYYKDKG